MPPSPRQSAKPLIGLLGGIGSGKSSVARCFCQLGCAVIDADLLARNLLQTPAIREKLLGRWGPGILDGQGSVDRGAVGKIVFADPAELRFLETLIHPPVIAQRARLREQYQQDDTIVALVDDTPLLLEKGLHKDCDVLVFVDAPEEIRLNRVMENRGWTARELTQRQAAQIALDKKAQLADYVVDNGADQAHCLEQVRRVLTQILATNRLPRSR